MAISNKRRISRCGVFRGRSLLGVGACSDLSINGAVLIRGRFIRRNTVYKISFLQELKNVYDLDNFNFNLFNCVHVMFCVKLKWYGDFNINLYGDLNINLYQNQNHTGCKNNNLVTATGLEPTTT